MMLRCLAYPLRPQTSAAFRLRLRETQSSGVSLPSGVAKNRVFTSVHFLLYMIANARLLFGNLKHSAGRHASRLTCIARCLPVLDRGRLRSRYARWLSTKLPARNWLWHPGGNLAALKV